MKKDELSKEAQRQGAEYSRKIKQEYERFWGNKYWDFTRRQKVKWMLSKIFRVAPGLTKIDALDVGCGIGFTALELALSEKVEHIKAIDVSLEALKVAEKLKISSSSPTSQKVTFEYGDYFDEEERNSFDCIYLHEVFEHIPDPDAVFQKAEKLLKPGGFLMISTPNYNRLHNRLLDLVGKNRSLIDPYHIKEYTFDEVVKERKGWEVISATGRGLFDEFVLSGIISCGIKKIQRVIMPLCRELSYNFLVYFMGILMPRISLELMVLYRRKVN